MKIRFAVFYGLAAPLLFVASAILFAWLRPDYSHAYQAISELGTYGAPYGTLWNMVGFALVGLLATRFALGCISYLKTKSKTTCPAWLSLVSAIGFVGFGAFPAEENFAPSRRTTLHFIMVFLQFVPFLVAAIGWGLVLKRDPSWRPWAWLSIGCGVIGLLSFAIPPTVPMGISQRIGLGSYLFWLFMLGWTMWREPNRVTQPGTASA